jgi:hypothetical protein
MAPHPVVMTPRPARAAPLRRLAPLPAAAFVLALSLLPGCDRTPRLVPAGDDSTAVGADDPYEVMLRNAGRAWESGALDEAADLTSRVLRIDLGGREPDTWARRATSLLDSMSVGAEVRGDECGIVVNLFARANPTGPSWPYAYWCDADSARRQKIEGEGLRLLDVAVRDVRGAMTDRGLAVLYGRGGGAGVMPTLMVWKAQGNTWRLAQTLGPDSLGGTGSGEFQRSGGDIELVTRTFRISSGFIECASCPHVEAERRFRWSENEFTKVGEAIARTPSATFLRFVQALRAADYAGAMGLASDPNVVERALDYGWGRSRQQWRVAPGTRDRASEMVFFLGQSDAYRVWFEPQDGDWAIASVDTTTRMLQVE